MRVPLTWLLLAGLSCLLFAATLDGFLSDASSDHGVIVAAAPPREGEDVPLPPCTVQNLALSIDVLGGSPFIALRHAWGKPCHLARLPVDLTVRDRAGRRVQLVTSESSVAGDFPRDFVRLIGITYLPTCRQRGPFVAFATVDPAYAARRRLPPVGCFAGP